MRGESNALIQAVDTSAAMMPQECNVPRIGHVPDDCFRDDGLFDVCLALHHSSADFDRPLGTGEILGLNRTEPCHVISMQEHEKRRCVIF